jgi:hypothetical protein
MKNKIILLFVILSTAKGYSQWNLYGNAGTYPYGQQFGSIGIAPQYVGTSDNTDFIIGTNNTARLIFSASGNIVAKNNFTVNQNSNVLGSLGVIGGATLGSLNVAGSSSLASNLFVGGPVVIGNNLPSSYGNCVSIATNASNMFGLEIQPSTNSYPSGGTGIYIQDGGQVGIYARAAQNNNNNYGGIFEASTNSKYLGIYGVVGAVTVPSGNTSSYAGYFEGNVLCYGSYVVSDARLKTKITPLASAISKLKQLKPCSYEFNNVYPQMNLPEGKQIGLLAQELQKVFPELVGNNIFPENRDRSGKIISESVSSLAVNYIGLIPVIIGGVNEQQTQLEIQESEITSLKSSIDSMKLILSAIKSSSLGLNSNLSSCSINQNNPNPFNQNTSIHLFVSSNIANAVVKVFNMSGTEVASYTVSTRGNSQITINANELSAGLYEYVLIADGNLIDSKKMILTN